MHAEQYKPTGSHMGRATPTGERERMRNGKFRQVTEYQEFIPTPSGEIEIHEWVELAMAAVKADGKEDLFERIKERVSELAWLKKDFDRNRYTLECMYHESYAAWPDFTVIWG